jgi:hypothetical protein
MTVLHGDFKQVHRTIAIDRGHSTRDILLQIICDAVECDNAAQENLLFSNNGEKCGAHDFQYCGAGLGAKDIAYLFCSGLSAELLPSHEEELLAHYHAELTALLLPRGLGGSYTMEVLREHFGFALIDFVRFMDGWGYWGNNRWATRKVEQTLFSVAHKLPRTSELF